MAKAAFWRETDAEERKPGDQTGLDTPVVLAVNGEHLMMGDGLSLVVVANALSVPPG